MKKNLIESNLGSFKFLIKILPKNEPYFVFLPPEASDVVFKDWPQEIHFSWLSAGNIWACDAQPTHWTPITAAISD